MISVLIERPFAGPRDLSKAYRRAARLPTLTSLQLLLRATVADDAEPTRLPISGVGATGT
jgi:hypothetical protein